ncbi:FAD/NAD(P)-binding protein [Vineibacter terrae]|nr:FAD/NAD(P)-binding protein [Vineibacter terrae]
MTIPSIAIVGAGASGTLLALQLSRKVPAGTRIVLIERNAQFGVGLAYSTQNPNHLVNIPNGRMSAFDDQPNHFVDWMQRQSPHILDGAPAAGSAFAPRRVYGAYLRDLLIAVKPAPKILHEEVVSIEVRGGLSRLRCASGRVLPASLVVFATGNDRPATPDAPGLKEAPFWRPDSWRMDAFATLDPGLPVLLIGTGPTAVDAVITLLDQGHVGLIYTVSRRGLLSRSHGPSVVMPIQLPLHAGLGELTRFVRQEADASGGNWRGVIDAVFPFLQDIWRSLSLAERQRFLRHLRPWWDVHRQRMPEKVAARIDAACTSGQLHILAGRITQCESNAVWLRLRGGRDTRLEVGRVVNCSGPCTDPARSDDPLTQAILRDGLARPDECRLGLDVTRAGALLSRPGTVSRSLFALGPPTRGAFWDITAIPVIRRQSEVLAQHLADLMREHAD